MRIMSLVTAKALWRRHEALVRVGYPFFSLDEGCLIRLGSEYFSAIETCEYKEPYYLFAFYR